MSKIHYRVGETVVLTADIYDEDGEFCGSKGDEVVIRSIALGDYWVSSDDWYQSMPEPFAVSEDEIREP